MHGQAPIRRLRSTLKPQDFSAWEEDIVRTITACIKSHPVLSYFILTFAISWGGFVLAVGPGEIPANPKQFKTMPLLAIPAMLAGPSVAGVVLTGLVHGRFGFRDLLTRMTRWRVGARWYAVALLTAPLLFGAILLPLSLVSQVFLPGLFASDAKVSFVLVGIGVGLIVGIFEELGWTGFAVPTLLGQRYGGLITGLIVGLLWGASHVLGNDIWASAATAGELPLALFIFLRGLGLLVGGLLAYRILMTWVYERTGGSLLLAMLMHASLSASTFVLGPLAGPGAMSGASLLIYDFVSGAALWALVAALALATQGRLSRQSGQ
ncbi:CPBP family intramembrane metalloprotease [Bradyrhizobium sp. BR13661]|uniref:CPBP family intramembrane glutamic endopeptidase n=1 Tax=Bradyrhizobium sp. BR13661 TaxID=2940622 RepID=UPI00247606A9|nr:CPBP family intramembrane metalloprotease [Bradyrhizobium sp. BR13661]MDH6257564.1 membrane protease YdiL (CAAX protease family) [Bradyrhizobium sp. BR13661]